MTFARRIYKPPPRTPLAKAWRRAVYSVPGDAIVARPKHEYVRSPALLAAVRRLTCQYCGLVGYTEAAHANWGWGKGRGIKCDDNRVAALAHGVHAELDQGKRWSEDEKKTIWWEAHVKTVRLLLCDGSWPSGVPVPDIQNCPWS
jgi:hypothetical protein